MVKTYIRAKISELPPLTNVGDDRVANMISSVLGTSCDTFISSLWIVLVFGVRER
jgi:hypothetical protein